VRLLHSPCPHPIRSSSSATASIQMSKGSGSAWYCQNPNQNFIALDLLNDDGQSDAIFTYYKHFRFPPGDDPDGVQPPPVPIDGRKKWKWMKTHCPTTVVNRGTELDWMNFYFAVHSTTANKLYFTDFKNIYLHACTGGTCKDKSPTWIGLRDAARALYGTGSPKALHWEGSGTDYGVNQ